MTKNLESTRDDISDTFFKTKNGAIKKKLCPLEDKIHQKPSSTKIGTIIEKIPKNT
jgi:hypothetical protein